MRKHMNQYKQLTEGQRHQISALLKVETLQKDIALILGVSPPTISRELDRNTGKGSVASIVGNAGSLSSGITILLKR